MLSCPSNPPQRYPAARWAVMTWRVDTHFLLYAFVALALSVIWDQASRLMGGSREALLRGRPLAGAACAQHPSNAARRLPFVLCSQVPHSGFGMAARFMDAVAVAHAIR